MDLLAALLTALILFGAPQFHQWRRCWCPAASGDYGPIKIHVLHLHCTSPALPGSGGIVTSDLQYGNNAGERGRALQLVAK